MSQRKEPAGLRTLLFWGVPALVLIAYGFAFRDDLRKDPGVLLTLLEE